MRSVAALILAALALSAGTDAVATGVATASADEVRAARCDSIRINGRSYVFYRYRVSCSFAKRWTKRLYRSDGDRQPPGYTCESGSGFRTGGSCETSGRARFFGWHPYD
jgi:hypothetical protein